MSILSTLVGGLLGLIGLLGSFLVFLTYTGVLRLLRDSYFACSFGLLLLVVVRFLGHGGVVV